MLLTNTKISKLREAFTFGSLAKIKLSKTQLNKIRQSGGFLGRLLGPLLKLELPLIGNVLKQLAKSVLMPLGLIVAASARDAAIHKKMFGSGGHPSDLAKRTILTIWNKEMNDIVKIVKSLEESGLLIIGVSDTI